MKRSKKSDLPVSRDQAIFIARQHLENGRIAQAEDLCRRVLLDQPNRPDAIHLLGVAASNSGKHEQAIALLEQTTTIDSNFAEAFADLGNALRRKGDLPPAIAAYHRAIQLQPSVAEVHNNLGIAFAEEEKLDDAIESYRRAIQLKPDMANAHFNLANAFRDQEKLDDAVAAYQRAIQIRPDFAQAHSNLGNALSARGQISAAVAAYDEAIRLSPDRPEPHWNRSLALLIQGDFERGWAEYEWRHRHLAIPACPGIRWNGENIAGKTILLLGEQGLGDAIQFIRYVPMVADLGARILLVCQPELCRLFDQIPNVSAVIPFRQPLPKFDVYCPLMSLPRIFNTRLDAIPCDIPYLKPDPALLEKWNGILGPAQGYLRIGLAWAGRPEHQYDHRRSMIPGVFAPLAAIEKVELHSLQTTASGTPLKDHSPMLTDFTETAALISNLDLVISVDTAVAHLAGALGKPVWLLLAFAPDWRWLLDRSDSPWYPTARLFRQQPIGDWTSVIQNICRELSSFRHDLKR